MAAEDVDCWDNDNYNDDDNHDYVSFVTDGSAECTGVSVS